MSEVDSEAALRARYRAPGERAVAKQLDRLDRHCRRFIELSPFVVMATGHGTGAMDASPRGGEPGFVKVQDDRTLLLPDWAGNNRLDSFANLVATGGIGLLFLVPGIDETLRVNGRATLSEDPALRAPCAEGGRLPKLVVRIAVREAYLHCAKALMRARLWDVETRVERGALPTMGQMIRDQVGSGDVPESQQSMVERYRRVLYDTE